jgi:hypothetical protein
MKKMIFILIIVAVTSACYGQEKDGAYYLPPSIQQKMKYAKDVPVGERLKLKWADAKFHLAEKNNFWPQFATNGQEVIDLLSKYIAVSEKEWFHGYSHTSIADMRGTLVFPDGDKYEILLRAGGLAAIVYPDGGIVYLAKSRAFKDDAQKNKKENP